MPGWLGADRRAFVYAAALAASALAVLILAGDARPSPEPAYAPLGAGLLAGALLLVRLRPGAAGSSLLIIPAIVAEGRFGLAGLPAVALASLVAGLVRRVSGPALLIGAANDTLGYALAHAASAMASTDVVARLATFAVVLVAARLALGWLAVVVGGPETHHPRADRPDLFLLLAVAPLGGLPLLAWQRLGDGALLVGLAALFAVLILMVEARNLATARAEVEAERDQLVRANELQRDLVHLITHELKNPLTSVLVYTQLVERALRAGAHDRIPEHVGRIKQGAHALQQLIDDLLQLSRLEQSGDLPDVERITPVRLLEEVASDLEPLAEAKHQALHTESTDEVADVLAPPLLLRQALSNLVSNAIKYTPEAGRVLLWARPTGAGEVAIGVTDTGIGLSQEDLARLFTKFFRSADPRARKERGSGLGLALTSAIIGRIGGRIEVESELNKGTTFRIVVPAARR
jgi:signal transduction histidine kinase